MRDTQLVAAPSKSRLGVDPLAVLELVDAGARRSESSTATECPSCRAT